MNKYFHFSIIFSEFCYVSYSAPVHFGWYGNRISLVLFVIIIDQFISFTFEM